MIYDWDFGDGGIGTGAFTTHPYSGVGPYTVTFTVTDSAAACAASSTQSFSLPNCTPGTGCNVDSTFTATAISDCEFLFTANTSDTSLIITWDFDDGGVGGFGNPVSNDYGNVM